MQIVGIIIRIIGLVIAVFGGVWCWQVAQIAPAVAGRTAAGDGNLEQVARHAIGVVCVGLVVFLIGAAISFLSKDKGA